MKKDSFKIDLLIDMASIFSEFMLNYSQEISKKALTNFEAFKLHNEMTNIYAGEAIKMMFEHIKDENIEAGFSDWLREHGFGGEKNKRRIVKKRKDDNKKL